MAGAGQRPYSPFGFLSPCGVAGDAPVRPVEAGRFQPVLRAATQPGRTSVGCALADVAWRWLRPPWSGQELNLSAARSV